MGTPEDGVSRDVLDLDEIDRTQVAVAGGKGANLGELRRIDGIRVPAGFCVTTAAFQRVVMPSIADRLDRLSRVEAADGPAIRALCAKIRQGIEGIAIPEDLAAAISGRLARSEGGVGWAVRSSATAEDLPTASFAGQQDTFLNVSGAPAVLQHIRRCWASLFTDRAVAYRLQQGIDHQLVRMAVVVQRMVEPQASGVLFTADPVTGDRRITSVEAAFGLGEALVSGQVAADSYTVRDDQLVDRSIATKPTALRASPTGGTQELGIDPDQRQRPALTEGQVRQLARLTRRIEAHLGRPQDIEWCLADDTFHIVQSRPITTLFPIPDADDGQPHVYVSVGHQQMMTDPIKPLGISMWQLTSRAPMREAGARLFVDVTRQLASPTGGPALAAGLGRSDPLIGDALRTVLDREIVPTSPDADPGAGPAAEPPPSIPTDPALVTELIARTRASLATAERDIAGLTGPALLDFILTDLEELRRVLFDPQSHQVVMAGMEAVWWLNEKLEGWLGERNAADALTQSVPDNVTSQMGLALLDVADVIRQHPEVVAALQDVQDDDGSFLDRLVELPGGPESRDAITAYLDAYGMRCVGEIDITRPRWRERPAALVPLILGNIRNFEPGAAARRFEQGRQEAMTRERELLARLRALPDGEQKAAETERMIDRARTFTGYREHPKYGMVSRYAIYKQALLEEADRLVQAQGLREADDIFFLTVPELHDVVRSRQVDAQLIQRRREAFRAAAALTPPRVLTSDGEAITGAYRRDDVPAGALVGLAVSAGTVEGRARVALDIAGADLEPGDILVTAFTDPSWTPAFVAIAGLVTEVGGQMTHGAVIAREYGLPAVVGVERATQLIRDGQRVRVHGTDGFVELIA